MPVALPAKLHLQSLNPLLPPFPWLLRVDGSCWRQYAWHLLPLQLACEPG